MAENTAAKVAIGTAVAGGAGLGIFLLTRKARAAEAEAEQAEREAEHFRRQAQVQRGRAGAAQAAAAAARGQAAAATAAAQSAAARAARAEQAARDALRREQYAQSLVAWTRAHAQQAGIAAKAAIDQANASARRAEAAAAQARRLHAQAAAEFHVDKRAALEREAGLKDRLAEALARKAQQDIERAQQAEEAADAQMQRERQATATAREAQKVREQQVVTARKEHKEAVKKAGPDLVNMECARQAVASGFRELKAQIQKNQPGKSDRYYTNATAAKMRADGIVLSKPDPSLPFWQQPCEAVRTRVRATINTYLDGVKQRKSRTRPPVTDPTRARPERKTSSVTTTPPDEARLLTEATWKAAIEYAVRASIAAGNPISSDAAERLIQDKFRSSSQWGPGYPAVPRLSAINAPSPWWAQSLSTIKKNLIRAYKSAVGLANDHFGLVVLALDPRGQVVWAQREDVQVDPNGKIIKREGPPVRGRRVFYPVLKSGARPVARDAELVGGSKASFSGSDNFGVDNYFGQEAVPFCTVV